MHSLHGRKIKVFFSPAARQLLHCDSNFGQSFIKAVQDIVEATSGNVLYITADGSPEVHTRFEERTIREQVAKETFLLHASMQQRYAYLTNDCCHCAIADCHERICDYECELERTVTQGEIEAAKNNKAKALLLTNLAELQIDDQLHG